ncbi:MAG: NAD(P)H-dependent glycerol-3-phosphate dehydrogenase [Pseudomonadota bacterium]
MTSRPIGIVGAGAWGTALAQVMATAGHEVVLWAHEPETAAAINEQRCNTSFLPDARLHQQITASTDLADLGSCAPLLLVTPAQHLRTVTSQIRQHVRGPTPLIVCAKGIERGSGALMLDVLREVAPDMQHGMLSGPSFAHDVAAGKPTALTLACRDATLGQDLLECLGSRPFRLYWTDDTIGVQLGGAMKNVLAIAAGIVAGRELGASAHAALVTRGFAELQRLGLALGARGETLAGLSGLGDLLLTCGSPASRNMSLGLDLGRGRSLADILSGRASVTEGVYTAAAVLELAQRAQVDMPISQAVHAILEGAMTVDDAINGLLSRPMKAELGSPMAV